MRAPAAGPPSTALRIGERLRIKGEIVGEGDLELAGSFEGLIQVAGRVVVGDQADVVAEIMASEIVIGGRVRGSVRSAGRVDIRPSGVLTGPLTAGSVTVAEGACVTGQLMIWPGGTHPPDHQAVRDPRASMPAQHEAPDGSGAGRRPGDHR
jgi:cytoskeletal protein CcmA (bactofilin family)